VRWPGLGFGPWARKGWRVRADKTPRWDERDDAASDLADVDEPEVLAALVRVGQVAEEDETLRETAGESIAALLRRHPTWDGAIEETLTPAALRGLNGA
jgi:hypothetical protein